MADNKTPPGASFKVATDEVTHSGETADVQLFRFVLVTGAEGSKTVVDLPGDASNGLDVDVTRLPALVAGTANIGDVDVLTLPGVAGDVAHDGGDSGNPLKIGAKAIPYAAQTAVAEGDRSNLYCDRHGSLFVIAGHPDCITIRLQFTAAQTDVAIVTVSAGTKIVVTRVTVLLDNASTVFPLVRIGFGAANTPTTTGTIVAHGGLPAGGGLNVGTGAGILGVGADGEDLRITTTGVATGNGVEVTVTYYTIPS